MGRVAPHSGRLCASSKPQGHEGNQSLRAEDPNPSYFLLPFLTPLFMVASFGSSKLELSNQMPLVVSSRGPSLRGRFHFLLLFGNELRLL